MENEIKDHNYFIIWLYISILLHLLAIIFMFFIKPNSLLQSERPTSSTHQAAEVIFVTQETQPTKPQPQNYNLAHRTQGGIVNMQPNSSEQKEAQPDIPEPALSKEYKTNTHNETVHKNQNANGIVNIDNNDTNEVVQEPVKAEPAFEKPTPVAAEKPQPEPTSAQIQETQPAQEKSSTKAQVLHAVLQEKELRKSVQQPIAAAHRIADIGSQNLSKVQISKQTQDTGDKKSKLSLLDIQKGFSQFVQNQTVVTPPAPSTSNTFGNSLFFSSTGNSDTDDLAGLKFASYMNQAGKMYQVACSQFTDQMYSIMQREGVPAENNQIAIVIDRSGKIASCTTVTSCGHAVLDNYHLKIIDAIGSFPPIPKYLDAPIIAHAQIPFKSIKHIRR